LLAPAVTVNREREILNYLSILPLFPIAFNAEPDFFKFGLAFGGGGHPSVNEQMEGFKN
jgi:hypothetical protein